jgi:iron complex outermembrane receptor protein
VLLASAGLWANPASAQEATDADVIVVTAARSVLPANALPLTMDIIDRRALDQQSAIAGSVVDGVSNLTPSFSPTRGKLSGAGETLRGRSPLYAINGIPQSTPLRDGSRDGFTIDPFFIDRVELIYGSNALQGIGGAGGIVNQVTVGPPAEDGVSGRALMQGNAGTDFDGDGLGWKGAGLLGYRAGRFDVTAGAAYQQRGAYYDGHGRRIGTDSTQGETQNSDSWSFFGRFGYALSDTSRLDLIASRFDLKGDGRYVAQNGNYLINLPTTSVRGDPPGLAAANRTESLGLSLTDKALFGGNFVSQIFWNRSRETFGGEVAPIATFQDARLAPVGTLFDQSQNRSRKYGSKISYERAIPGFEALTATVGFDTLFDRTEQLLIATGRVWVPPANFRSLAPFGQVNLALFDKKLRLAGGVRNENVRIKIDDYTTLASYGGGHFVRGGAPKFSDTLFNGGVIVEPTAGVRAYASYAQGYTVPDVGRIARAVNADGVDIDDYVNINPIVSNNQELGLEIKRGPFDVSTAYFWSKSAKGQVLVFIGGAYEAQRQKVAIEGLEINASAVTPLPGLRLSVGYAHLKGRTDTDGDGRLDADLDGANISPDRVNIAASYDRGPIAARLQTQVFLSRKFDGQPAANDFQGYVVTDVTVRYQTQFGGITLSAQNIFDTFYIDYYSDTVRPTDNARLFAGRGRNVTLGWDYRF